MRQLLNHIWSTLVTGQWWLVLWWALWSCLFTLWYGAEWASPFWILLGLNAYRFGEGAPCRR